MRVLAFFLAAGLVFGPAATAHAQSPGRPNLADSPPPDELTAEARKRFIEGMTASESRQYERARIAYLQAYALKQEPGVARNLAVAEIDSGHLLTGARRLAEYLRGKRAATETDEAREFAKRMLKETEARLGRLAISVDEPGADILVNGSVVGRSPLGFEWHVEPGPVTVTARKDGIERRVALVASAGVVTPVSLELGAQLSPAAPADSSRPSTHVLPSSPPLPAAGSRSTPLLIGAAAGGVLTLASLAVTLVARKDYADARDEVRDLTDEAVSRYGNPPCATAASRSTCDELLSAERRRINAGSVANFGLVATGALALGSTAALVGWFYSKPERRLNATRVEPWISTTSGGMSVRHHF